MIKRNESDIGKTVQILLFYIVFSIDKSFKLVCNQIFNFNGVCIKMKHFEAIIYQKVV